MISVGQTPETLWNAGGGIATIANISLITPVYITYGTTGTPNASSDQIPPLGAIVADGSTTIQGSTLSNVNLASVQIMPGVTQWGASPAQIAEQIALSGLPIIPADLLLAQVTATSVAAGASKVVYDGPVTGLSYAVSFDAITVNAPGDPATVPMYKVSFLWKDGQGGNLVGPPQHYFPVITNVSPANQNALVGGRGPTQANWVQILIKNLDTAAIIVDAELLQSSRPVEDHKLRSVSNNILGSYVYGGVPFPWPTPISDCNANILGFTVSANLAHGGGGIARLNGLYAGEVQVCVQLGPAVNSASLTLYAVDPEFSVSTPIIYSSPPITTSIFVQDITLPATQVLLVLANNDAAVDATAAYTMIAKQAAT